MSSSSWIDRLEYAPSVRIENRARMLNLIVRTGTGTECAYCHKRIGEDAVEYEVTAEILARLRTLHFHRVCQHLWEELTSTRNSLNLEEEPYG